MAATALALPALIFALLASSAAVASRAHAASNTTRGRIAALVQTHGASRDPAEQPAKDDDEHPVPQKLLRKITSIECLEIKQRDPKASCEPGPASSPTAPRGSRRTNLPELSIGSFPTWREQRCHSSGEFFCDPENVLAAEAQTRVTHSLQAFKEDTMVTCGVLPTKMSGEDQTHIRQFNLGVVVAEGLPQSEIDSDTLQNFGLVLMSQWGLLPLYNGVDSQNYVTKEISQRDYIQNCPNTAMLILLPSQGEAYVASPSCEFFCAERGGPEIRNAMIKALESGGVEEAIEVGIQQVRRILAVTTALSLERHDRAYAKRDIYKMRHGSADSFPNYTENVNMVQRVLFAGILFVFLVSLLACAFVNLSPAENKSLRKGAYDTLA